MIRPLVHGAARWSGLNTLSRYLLRQRPLVLCYHGVCGSAPDVPDLDGLHVPRDLFRRQLEALLAFYTPVSLSQVRSHVLEDPGLPQRAVLLTFDDGYRNVARNGLPLLRELGIPCAWFVVPGAIEEGTWLWPAEVAWRHPNRRDYRRVRREMRRLTPRERRDRLAGARAHPGRPDCDYTLATWTELAAELQAGSVEIGSHGLNHDLLSTSSPAERQAELEGSAALIRRRLGVAPYALAYPGGDHSAAAEQAARIAGYRLGFTTAGKHMRPADGPLRLPRILVGRRDTPDILLGRLAGWREWLQSRP